MQRRFYLWLELDHFNRIRLTNIYPPYTANVHFGNHFGGEQ